MFWANYQKGLCHDCKFVGINNMTEQHTPGDIGTTGPDGASSEVKTLSQKAAELSLQVRLNQP